MKIGTKFSLLFLYNPQQHFVDVDHNYRNMQKLHRIHETRYIQKLQSCLNVLTDSVTEATNDTTNITGQPVPVQSIFGWIIWMRRTGTAFNWNLPWTSYKNGFGSFSGSNFWLGLERVNLLTNSSKYRLRIEIKLNTTGDWQSVEYWSFTVGDENSTKYQLNVDGYAISG